MASDDSVVVSAPSVEEAIIIGLTRLTATRDEVDIEVLDEGNKGFLGIGSRVAQVRLTRRPRDVGEKTAAPLLEPAASPPAATEPEPMPQAEAPVVPEPPETAPVSGTAAPAAAEAEDIAAPQATPDAVSPAVSTAPEPAPEARKRPRPPKPEAQLKPRGDGLDRDGIEAVAREIMENLLQGLSVEISVEWIDEDRPTLWVAIGGRDADALVGPRARNLHSLQYLFRALVYHKADGNYNVVVDADGYRRRRRRSLESMAQKKADQAVEQGQTVRLRAMPAHERRIIHIILREDDRVTTESVGRGRDRAVTIVPVGSDASRNGS